MLKILSLNQLQFLGSDLGTELQQKADPKFLRLQKCNKLPIIFVQNILPI